MPHHMLSRVANSVYWMSRYLERAENVARFIDVNTQLMLDLPPGTGEQWAPLIQTTGDLSIFRERYEELSGRNVIHFLTFDTEYPNSIISSLRLARENGRTIREIISSEMWEQLNVFYHMVEDASALYREYVPATFFTEIKQASHLLTGLTYSTMSHGEPWHFGRMGRYLERADKTSRILDVKYYILLPNVYDVGTPLDDLQWSALLKSASALEMYRKKYGLITPGRVAEFLIMDREFPRAIHYCLGRAEESLHAITGTPMGSFSNPAEQHLGRLRSELDYTQISEIIARGLHEYLDDLQVRMNRVDDMLFETFFALKPVPRVASAYPD